MTHLIIEKITSRQNIPFDLLLLADETITAIEKYVYDADVYIARRKEAPKAIAVFVLLQLNAAEIEIKNIAVAETFQNTGIGSYLLEHIREIACESGYRKLWVGTPDCSKAQISFYKKNGFEISGVKKNFFTDNYPDPIIEDGILLKDMVMLSMNII